MTQEDKKLVTDFYITMAEKAFALEQKSTTSDSRRVRMQMCLYYLLQAEEADQTIE